MFKTFLIISLLAIAALAFDMQPISVASHVRLEPPVGITPTAELPVADNLARIAIAFALPDSFMLPSNAIIEALLTVKIIPDAELAHGQPLEIFCIPQTASPTSALAFAEITEDMLNVSEVGIYDPETGTVFFEIAHMLQRAAIGDFPFYGIALVPAKGSGTFRISPEVGAIDLRVAYAIGKREVER